MKREEIIKQLEERNEDRLGKRVKWRFATNAEIQNDILVWMQPVTLAEYELAHSLAVRYVKTNLQIEDAMVIDQALNIELLALAIRDEQNHSKQIFSAFQLRNWLTLDEIAILEKQFNMVTVECSPIKVLESEEMIEALLASIGVEGASEVLEPFAFSEVLQLVDRLSNQVKELESQLEKAKQ